MIGERIAKARKDAGYSDQKALSSVIKVGARTLADYETNNSEPKASTLKLIAENCNVSSDWLLFGEKEPTAALNNHCFEIDMLNVKAGAGSGIYNYEVEVIDKIVLDKAFFRNAPDINKVKIIEVDGDSMEPTLYNGDFIIIDESKTNKIDGIYAIQLDGQLLVKRLEFNLDNTITIISDNKRYSSKIYDPKETQIPFHLIGMKTLSIQR